METKATDVDAKVIKMRKNRMYFLFVIAFVLVAIGAATAMLSIQETQTHQPSLEGIMVTDGVKHTVPLNEILTVLPQDAIPAIDDPNFVSAQSADVTEEDIVLGLFFEGEAYAYPIKIMNWHEVVNQRINGDPISVTYCPLCGTGIAFSGIIENQETTFGVSGKLYNSDLVMYDRLTDSYWSQVEGASIQGELAGVKLTQIFLETARWRDWVAKYPDTLVLSEDTGFTRDYNSDPYEGYEFVDSVRFPLNNRDNRLGVKERVVGVEVDGAFKAYPVETVREQKTINDELNGKDLIIIEDPDTFSIKVFSGEEQLPTVEGFWFAWAAFHPETEVYI